MILSAQQMPIMAHLVLGYPSLEESIRTAERYIAGGTAILELQIPFSHPTADGPVITHACQKAIEQKVTVPDCLQAIRTLREKHPGQEMMVMSYLNRVYTYGIERFSADLNALSIENWIVPDLPIPAPSPLPKHLGNKLVPVLAANTSKHRLRQLLEAGHDFFYLMSDFKITGSTFSLHPNLRELTTQIKTFQPENRVGVGFGIETPEQVLAVLEVADYAIIGSTLIRAQQKGQLDDYLTDMRKALEGATFVR